MANRFQLVAVWCLAEWEKCGAPKPLQIVELGPGRGTLAQDILRVFSRFQLSNDISLHLVEVSPYLSAAQAKRLCCKHAEVKNEPFYQQGETISGIRVFWYKRIEDVPKEFSLFLAHEFFDAMPIHKFQLTDGKWREIMVDVDRPTEEGFRFVASKADTPMQRVFLQSPLAGRSHSHVEFSPETDMIVENLSRRIEEHGGFSLIMDYGHIGDKTDTFRVCAVRFEEV